MDVWLTRDIEPPKNRPIVAYCPDWCDMSYQICEWDGKEYGYRDQPNEMFNETVLKWLLFEELK